MTISLKSVLPGLLVAGGILVSAEIGAAETDNEEQPLGHFEISNPARLSAADSAAIYKDIGQELADRYRMSEDSAAVSYRSWSRHSIAPYLSATHGARFVSNYANAIARDYGRLGKGERLPVGSVLAKDSFTVRKNGQVFPGALFIMQKMQAGFNKASADWQYRMILPDGSLFGVTRGENRENVEFCIACHARKSGNDHLFYVPGDYRRR